MDGLLDILTGTQKGWFTTIHVPNQIVGEIDPFFVVAFFEELTIDWKIYDAKGIQHDVQFNGSANKPLLTTGWERLRSYYSWTENQKLFFFYYGGNNFYMLINNDSNYDIPSFFPTFHSMSTSVGNTRTFIMRIGADHVPATTMTISQDIDIFIRARGLHQIKLCGPLNNIVTVNVIRSSESSRRFKFGEGWKNFCELNQIVDGNRLCFEASGEMGYSNILLIRVV